MQSQKKNTNDKQDDDQKNCHNNKKRVGFSGSCNEARKGVRCGRVDRRCQLQLPRRELIHSRANQTSIRSFLVLARSTLSPSGHAQKPLCHGPTSERFFKSRAPFWPESRSHFWRAIDFAGFRHAIHEFTRALACIGRRRGCCCRRGQIASVRRGLRCGRLRGVLWQSLACRRQRPGFVPLKPVTR